VNAGRTQLWGFVTTRYNLMFGSFSLRGYVVTLPGITVQVLLLTAYLRAAGTKVQVPDTAVGAGCKEHTQCFVNLA